MPFCFWTIIPLERFLSYAIFILQTSSALVVFTFHFLLRNEHWPRFLSFHKEQWPKDLLSSLLSLLMLRYHSCHMRFRIMHKAPSGIASHPFEMLLSWCVPDFHLWSWLLRCYWSFCFISPIKLVTNIPLRIAILIYISLKALA